MIITWPDLTFTLPLLMIVLIILLILFCCFLPCVFLYSQERPVNTCHVLVPHRPATVTARWTWLPSSITSSYHIPHHITNLMSLGKLATNTYHTLPYPTPLYTNPTLPPLHSHHQFQCLDMTTLATLSTVNGDLAYYTYGAIPNNPLTWDAEKVDKRRLNFILNLLTR